MSAVRPPATAGAIPIAAALALLAVSAGCGDGAARSDPAPADPPPSAGHELVWHDALGAVVLVNAGLGGVADPPREEPTRLWAWDGERWSLLAGGGPPVRNLGAVAYDARREVIVLHGGTYDAEHSYGDTWEWSHAGGWTRRDEAGPGVRDHAQMAYDAVRERVVLFGGQSELGAYPATTWTWDGAAWEEIAAAPAGPSPRVHHALAWDPDLEAVILFGGHDPGSGDLGDTWTFDGSAWTELPPDAPARTHGRMAFDGGLGKLVLVGGAASGAPVLARGGAGWEPLAASGAPTARYLPGVAYDRLRAVLVVFGGGDPSTDALRADTWELAGTSWSRR
jgi:hypothetical protein